MTGRAVLAAALASTLLAGCGGQSAQDQARSKVCDARTDISKQVDTLKGLTPSTVTADAVRKPLQSIADDLQKIADAQGDLNGQRRQEIEQANKAFTDQVRQIGSTVLRSTSTQQAKQQLQTATTQLKDAYRKTLGTVSCG